MMNAGTRHVHATLAAALLAAAPACWAEVSFNGFGQVVAGSALDDDKPFPGLAYDGDVAFEPESLFALQARAPLSSGMDAVVQIVGRGSEDFDPDLTWAYVNFRLNDELALKAGRQRLALYRYSEYLEVGVAYPFMRAPRSVYDNTVNNGDGLTLSGRYSYGNWLLQPQLQYFEVDTDGNVGGIMVHIRLKNLVGAVIDASYDDWLNLRASYFHTSASAQEAQVEMLLDALVAGGEADAAAELRAENDAGYFWSASFDVHRECVLFGGEYIHYESPHSFFGTNDGWYLNAGYRWGTLTPIVVWGEFRAHADNDAQALIDPAHPLYPAVVGLDAAARRKDDFLSLGLRYDLRDNVALKFDYTRRSSEIDGVPNARLLSAGLIFSF